MELPSLSLVSISPLYATALGLLFVVITLRAGLYRVKTSINIGDGGDPEMLRRIRGQGNFVETVPLALILIVMLELMGAGATWVHALGALLVFGRCCHYLAITELGPFALRPVGMMSTLAVYLVCGGWIIAQQF